VKHAEQRGIWVPTQNLLWDQGKLRIRSIWSVAGPSDHMRGLLLFHLLGLCDMFQFCSAFRQIVERCQWVGVATAGLDFLRIVATCEYLDCGYM
jgi:hypothetical protein